MRSKRLAMNSTRACRPNLEKTAACQRVIPYLVRLEFRHERLDQPMGELVPCCAWDNR
jgi:hypothetical protein